MAQGRTTGGRRIAVRLDPEVLVESLILDQLADLPRSRHGDRLRTLLVLGLLAEQRGVRRLREGVANDPGAGLPRQPAVPTLDYAAWRRQALRAKAPEAPAPTDPAPATVPTAEDKPFARLRQVVG